MSEPKITITDPAAVTGDKSKAEAANPQPTTKPGCEAGQAQSNNSSTDDSKLGPDQNGENAAVTTPSTITSMDTTTMTIDDAWPLIRAKTRETAKIYHSIREHFGSLVIMWVEERRPYTGRNPKMVFLSIFEGGSQVDFPVFRQEIQEYLDSSFPRLGLKFVIEQESNVYEF